jgi:hypothetical protein
MLVEKSSSKMVDKGKKIIIDPYMSRPKSRVVHFCKREPYQRFVPTCYHGDKVGYIQPNCFKLKPYELVSDESYNGNSHEGCLT